MASSTTVASRDTAGASAVADINETPEQEREGAEVEVQGTAPVPPIVDQAAERPSISATDSSKDHFCTGEVFRSAVAPFLSNRDLFTLSGCARGLLRLRYDLGNWAVKLTDSSYEAFRIKRTAVPVCFQGLSTFDLAEYLGPRLRVSMRNSQMSNADALAGVHCLDLTGCYLMTDVSSLGDVTDLNLSGCYRVTDVSALGGVTLLNLSKSVGVTDASALGG
jgi:hypothetical protein